MSSLGEIAQIYGMLVKIDELLGTVETKINKTESDTEKLTESFNKLEQTALRYLAIVNKLGLPKDAQQVLDVLTRTIVVLRQAQLTAYQFAIAVGPIGWAFAGAGLILTAFSAGDLLMDLG